MAFHLKPTSIPEVKHIVPDVYGDDRGYFMELYKKTPFEELGIPTDIVQEAMSFSKKKGVLRGVHFQKPPHGQGKIVHVMKGAVLDVAVDVRRGSPTHGQYIAVELNDRNKESLYVPVGFAHGIEILEDETIFQYLFLHSEYAPESEGGIVFDDPELGLPWRLLDHELKERDRALPRLGDLDSPFVYEG